MNRNPEITLIVLSQGRSSHLERCLVSLSRQSQAAENRFEVIVADSALDFEGAERLRHLSMKLPYRLRVASNTSRVGFPIPCVLNEAVSKAEGEYLILTDGDCVFRTDFVYQHLQDRRRGVFWSGGSLPLSQQESDRISLDSLVAGSFLSIMPERLSGEFHRQLRSNRLYRWLNRAHRVQSASSNMALWKEDLIAINGFDQSSEKAGLVDGGLSHRLRLSGLRIKSNVRRTFGYHLWHPPKANSEERTEAQVNHLGTENDLLATHWFLRECVHGLVERRLEDLRVRISAAAKQVSETEWPLVVRLREHFSALPDHEQTHSIPAELEVRIGASPTSQDWANAKRVQVLLDGRSVGRSWHKPDLVINTQGMSSNERPELSLLIPRVINGELREERTPIESSKRTERIIPKDQTEETASWILGKIAAKLYLPTKRLIHPAVGEASNTVSVRRAA